jgi:hypothetical protein
VTLPVWNESSREPAPGWPPSQTPATVPQQQRQPGSIEVPRLLFHAYSGHAGVLAASHQERQ